MSHSYHIKTEIVPVSKMSSSTTKMGLQALAEVAIGRLLEEQDEASAASTKIINRAYTLKQIRKLSEKKLLTTFTVRTKRVYDKNDKRFEYRCQILPHLCQQSFECIPAEETKLKENIVKHLNGHLCNLEKSEPSVKINCRRAVKVRPVKQTQVTSSATPVAKKSTNTKRGNAAGKGGVSSVTSAVVGSLPVVVGAPLDMSTTSSSASLALKFLEEDHPYTVSTDPALVARSGILTEALNSAGITPDAFLETPLQQNQQTMDVRTTSGDSSGGMVLLDGSSSSSASVIVKQEEEQNFQQQQQQTPPSANVRALALDYIDDIRKKSSSAAKPVLVNGDKSLIYQCKLCPDKQFTSTNGLIFHYKKHAGLKPYVCELCSATFTRQHSLNYHMLIHLNKSRFVCQECGRHFRHPSHFKEHMRRHTGETPFQCADCLIRFKTRNTYKRHLQTKHAKILTSKGIIELSGATGGPGVTYQTNVVDVSSPGSTGSSVKAMKPRSKYAMRYALAPVATTPQSQQQQTQEQSYDQSQQMEDIQQQQQQQMQEMQQSQEVLSIQQPILVGQTHKGLRWNELQEGSSLQVQHQQPIDYSQQPQNLSMHPSTTASTPITIVQIPGVQGVTILDNTGAPAHGHTLSPSTMAAIAAATQQSNKPLQQQLHDLTTTTADSYHHHQANLQNLQHLQQSDQHHHQQQGITLVSYHHQAHPSSLEPIQSTATLLNSPPISSGPLTELTSSPALGMVQQQNQQHHQMHQLQQHHQQPSNDNFNMLLAAIEMTEDPKQEANM